MKLWGRRLANVSIAAGMCAGVWSLYSVAWDGGWGAVLGVSGAGVVAGVFGVFAGHELATRYPVARAIEPEVG